MERVNYILKDKRYKLYLEKIKKHEENRIYCRHDLEHFLNMSRIAYIMILEKNLKIDKEVVYAIGLLHDIGRWKQYEEGIDHHKASAMLSREILIDSKFEEQEINFILEGILNHRALKEDSINDIFYKADKLSRNCIECLAKDSCNWKEEKKNFVIKY